MGGEGSFFVPIFAAMSRIVGLDLGQKRTGIAVTDPLQLIVNGLTTVSTDGLRKFLKNYFIEEDVEKVVIGYPSHTDGNPTKLQPLIDDTVAWISRAFPTVDIDFEDEGFTSHGARQIIRSSHLGREARSDKELVDQVSAVLILQQYLKHV